MQKSAETFRKLAAALTSRSVFVPIVQTALLTKYIQLEGFSVHTAGNGLRQVKSWPSFPAISAPKIEIDAATGLSPEFFCLFLHEN